MGYYFVEEDIESYFELPESFKQSVEKTLKSVGITRFGNCVIEEYRNENTEVVVKVQRGSGQDIDLTNARKVNGEIVHLSTMLHEGKIEIIHENGYITLSVRARY